MKKPFLHALVAALYIVIVVSVMHWSSTFKPEDNIFAPMIMLSLLVFSVAFMGFIFLYESIKLYMEGKKQEALSFFTKILGFFACFVVLFLILFFLL